jgi:hypothetical protein
MKKKPDEFTVTKEGGNLFPSLRAALENSMPHLLELFKENENEKPTE